MAKCKDCLHYEACLTFSKFINAARDVEQGCEHFKDRTNCVEVVRCKACISFRRGKCDNLLVLPNPYPDSFCSFGERRSE